VQRQIANENKSIKEDPGSTTAIMRIAILLFISLLLVCSKGKDNIPSELKNTPVNYLGNMDSPFGILHLVFRIGNNVDSIPPLVKEAFKKLVLPDSIRMYNFDKTDSSGSTDLGRRLHIFGINQKYALIVYDRLGCFTGRRILLIFTITDLECKPFWAGDIQLDWQTRITNIEEIKALFENGNVHNRPFTSEYIL
jgi:hypothetical protein